MSSQVATQVKLPAGRTNDELTGKSKALVVPINLFNRPSVPGPTEIMLFQTSLV
jgi:hypothetical protein